MVKFNIICHCKIKWWVKPLIGIVKAWVLVTRKNIDVDRLADFVASHGIKKQYITKEI